jgi:hypothetical protein
MQNPQLISNAVILPSSSKGSSRAFLRHEFMFFIHGILFILAVLIVVDPSDHVCASLVCDANTYYHSFLSLAAYLLAHTSHFPSVVGVVRVF